MPTSLALHDDSCVALEPTGDLPPALQRLIGSVVGQDWVSVDDLYLWGGQPYAMDPALRRAVLLIVNRRRQRPPTDAARHESLRTLFLLRSNHGEYLCGRCFTNGTRIVFQPRSGTTAGWREFPLSDVRVIGQVTGIVSAVNVPCLRQQA